jgi:hypothetical protein
MSKEMIVKSPFTPFFKGGYSEGVFIKGKIIPLFGKDFLFVSPLR